MRKGLKAPRWVIYADHSEQFDGTLLSLFIRGGTVCFVHMSDLLAYSQYGVEGTAWILRHKSDLVPTHVAPLILTEIPQLATVKADTPAGNDATTPG